MNPKHLCLLVLVRNQRKIRVLNPNNGRIAVCLVNDMGPWNTKDAYWKTQTRPRAEAQFTLKQKADNKQVPSIQPDWI